MITVIIKFLLERIKKDQSLYFLFFQPTLIYFNFSSIFYRLSFS